MDRTESTRIVFGDPERDAARTLIELALAEDLGPVHDDITTRLTIPPDLQGKARIVARQSGVFCGGPLAVAIARQFEVGASLVSDGTALSRGQTIGELTGPLHQILTIERTLLNFVQRLSGVASLTARYVEAVHGTRAVILDTRKTTPGWRLLEKYAVRCGGGRNHRMGLHDAVLIKDNHLAALAYTGDPIAEAIGRARKQAPPGMIVEIEVDSLEQLDRALTCLPDIVLIDNFSREDMREAVRRRDAMALGVLLEASGGVNLESVASIAETGVDRISVGALTHSAPALDIALDFDV